jgi:hypothetical protein
MKMKERLPWDLPVPVRKSKFRTNDPALRAFNIESSFSPMSGYRDPKKLKGEVMYCDFQSQITPLLTSGVILGSGRAGRYRNKWVKGLVAHPCF